MNGQFTHPSFATWVTVTIWVTVADFGLLTGVRQMVFFLEPEVSKSESLLSSFLLLKLMLGIQIHFYGQS